MMGSCGSFCQLESGAWAGDSFSGIKVSLETFEQGKCTDRLKYLSCRMATEEEIQELKIKNFPPPHIVSYDCQCGQGGCYTLSDGSSGCGM